MARWMASAAATARSGSSSCATGAPNTAMVASPMCLSTEPPCSTISSSVRARKRSTMRRISSAPSVLDSSVKLQRSANSTATCRRSASRAARPAPLRAGRQWHRADACDGRARRPPALAGHPRRGRAAAGRRYGWRRTRRHIGPTPGFQASHGRSCGRFDLRLGGDATPFGRSMHHPLGGKFGATARFVTGTSP